VTKESSFDSKEQTRKGGHVVSCAMGTMGSCTGLKQPRHYVDHVPSCSAKDKKAWNCTFTPPCLHGMYRDKLTLAVAVAVAVEF